MLIFQSPNINSFSFYNYLLRGYPLFTDVETVVWEFDLPEVKQVGSVQLGFKLCSQSFLALEKKLKLARYRAKKDQRTLTTGYLINFLLFMHLSLFKVITINKCLKKGEVIRSRIWGWGREPLNSGKGLHTVYPFLILRTLLQMVPFFQFHRLDQKLKCLLSFHEVLKVKFFFNIMKKLIKLLLLVWLIPT